jgi:tetratricopeptide (TPR) repeat protein
MTSARGRSSASGSGAALAAALLAAAFLGAGGPARAGVEEEDIAGTLERFRTTLEEGRKRLAALDYPEAIEAFTQVIDAYKTGRVPLVTPDARQLVAGAYEGRALAQANLGRGAAATEDFEALVRFDPAHAVDLKGVSPKIVGLYAGVRKRLIGVLTVEGDPIGAEVFANDQLLGITPLIDREILAGVYRLRIARAGHDPHEEEVRVEAGGKLERRYRLPPNARSILVATVPRDVRVLVRGADRGTTFGAAGPEYDEVAARLKVARAEISAPLLVENLPPGEHEMLLRKECYEEMPVRVGIQIDPNDNAPLAYEPFVLRPSRGALEIESDPPGASILLDGRPAGTAPLALEDLCAGPHDLVMEREGLGRFAGVVEVRKDETVRVGRRLRLSLAAFDARPGLREPESLGALLADLERYNVLHEGSGVPPEAAERVRLESESSQGRGLSERTVRDLMRALKAEMIALALPAGPLGEQVDVLLYGPLHPVPDRRRLPEAGLEGFRRVRYALDAEVPVRLPWSGLKLIDVAGKGHPVVLAVTSGSPAELAGAAPGDLLVAVGSAPMTKTADLHALLRRSGPGEEARLTLETAGKPREVKIKYLATPLLLPMKDPEILYNKVIADLTSAAARAANPTERAYAWLNIGAALMHFGQWETAVREALRKADLPDAAGVSRGTVRYLTAICYEKLGLTKEAGAAYAEAAASAQATLESHDGPPLAPAARRRAALLGGAR